MALAIAIAALVVAALAAVMAWSAHVRTAVIEEALESLEAREPHDPYQTLDEPVYPGNRIPGTLS